MKDPQKIDWRYLALALLVTLVVRSGVLIAMGSSLLEDPDAYRRIAVDWSGTGTLGVDGVPSAYRPPLYPTVLRFLGSSPVAVAILHVLFGLATVAMTFVLCVRIGLGRWAFWASMLVAFDPILLNQSTLVMTETLATMLLTLTIFGFAWFVWRPTFRHARLAGFFGGLAGLCRPEFLAGVGWCVLALPWVLRGGFTKTPVADNGANHHTEKRRATLLSMTVLAYMILTLLPWTIRNWMVFGEPTPATTHGGYTFLLANNGPFYEYLRSGEPGTTWDADELGPRWAGKARFDSPDEELQANHDAYREACGHIRREPGIFFYSCLVRVGRLWALMPHQGSTPVRYAIGLWYLVIYALALTGIWTLWRRRSEWRDAWRTVFVWGVMLIVMTTAIHTFFWSNMRMRAPLIPVLAIIAMVGLARLIPRRQCNMGSKSKAKLVG